MMPNKLYTLPSIEKEKELLDNLNLRLQLHYESSLEFRRIINGFFADKLPAKSLKNLPFIPVRLFKTLDLKSVVDSDIVKTMTSSGTSGQGASKIRGKKVYFYGVFHSAWCHLHPPEDSST